MSSKSNQSGRPISRPSDPWKFSDREGYVTDDGKIRIFGFSQVPEEELSEPLAAGDGPLTLRLEAGRYSWCTCGHSQNQPFCDNAHREADTNRKSYKFEVLEQTTIEFCMCKRTSTPPFCDGMQHHCGQAGGQGDSDG